MAEDYWSKRWQRGEIGFHQKEVNAQLRRFWPHLAIAPGSPVLVPLCGKSEDMAWLRAQGHTVIGIDLAEQAVRAFFAEHEREPVHHKAGPLERWSAAGFELYVGDFFALRAEQLAGARAVYDRAALIALPPAERQRYARHLEAIMPTACNMLLMTVDYPQQAMPGPPFSVPESEVRELYGAEFSIQILARRDILEEEPRFRSRGLKTLTEQVYLLERPARSAEDSKEP